MDDKEQAASVVLFDEQALYREICRIWGEYGAHAEVFRDVLASSSHREAEVKALREALQEAERRLFGAWQMLEAICESDYSRDRRAAADKALAGLNAVRAALKE